MWFNYDRNALNEITLRVLKSPPEWASITWLSLLAGGF